MANLLLTFKNKENYIKGIEFFSTESKFFPNDTNDEFRSLYFQIEDGDDADSTEYYIEQELQETEIQDYYFEIEENESGNWY